MPKKNKKPAVKGQPKIDNVKANKQSRIEREKRKSERPGRKNHNG